MKLIYFAYNKLFLNAISHRIFYYFFSKLLIMIIMQLNWIKLNFSFRCDIFLIFIIAEELGLNDIESGSNGLDMYCLNIVFYAVGEFLLETFKYFIPSIPVLYCIGTQVFSCTYTFLPFCKNNPKFYLKMKMSKIQKYKKLFYLRSIYT